MDMHSNVAMNQAQQTAPDVTVESVTQAMYDALLNLGGEIDMLESRLSSLTHPEESKEPGGLSQVRNVMPEAIEKMLGLQVSIERYRDRLVALRLRLAV